MSESSNLKRFAVGCGVFALICGIALCIAGYFIYKQGVQIKDDLKNPGPRTLEILGTDALPEGYYPNIAMSVPFIMDSVVISDQKMVDGKPPRMGEGKGFLYSLIKIGKESDSAGLEAFFSGKSDDMSALNKNHINVDFDPKDVLARGIMEMDGVQVRYFTTKKGFSSEQARADGLTTFFMLQCANSNKVRFAVWFSEQMLEAEPPYDLTNTVGDEAVIQSFLAHFNFCGPKQAEK